MGYHLYLNDQTSGPFSEEEVRTKLRAGEINENTLAAKEGDTEWTPLSQTGLTQSKIRLKTESKVPVGTVGQPMEDAPVASSLQFDRAEFEQPTSGIVTCSACKQSVHDSYYHINGLVVCGPCKDKVESSGAGRLSLKGFGKSTLFGAGAAIAGATVWYAVRELTGYEIALIGIAVGLLVGVAVKRGSRGWGGWQYQVLAMVLTYFAIASTYVPPLFKAMKSQRQSSAQPATTQRSPADNEDAPADSSVENPNSRPKSAFVSALAGLPKPLRVVVGFTVLFAIVFALACAVPFLAGVQNFLGWIIIGIALYEAWKINRRVPLEITGPYKIAPPASAS